MLAIERAAKNRQNFVFSSIVKHPGFENLYQYEKEPNDLQFHVGDVDIRNPDFQNSFQTQGGIFADEMGLGKTISMISLILSNPRIPKPDGNYHPCIRTAEAFEKEPLFESPATLVICPSHLVNQWTEEIKKNTELNVKSVATAAQHRKLKYEDCLTSDVIVVSYNYMGSNLTYINFCDKRSEEVRKSSASSSTRSRRKVELKNPTLTHGNPIFHLIGWHRLIIDEAHEIIHQGLLNFDDLHCNFRWYVTGTPFPNKSNSFYTASRFLKVQWKKAPNSRIVRHCCDNISRKILFWRNTKLSVENQVEIPPVIEDIKLVYLSAIEKTLYDVLSVPNGSYYHDNYIKNGLRQFLLEPSRYYKLGDPQLAEKEINRLQQTLAIEIKYLEDLRKEAENPNTEAYRSQNIRAYDIPRYEKSIMHNTCKLACFSRLISPEANENTDFCDSCEEFSSSRSSLPCNHSICHSCLLKMIDNGFFCLCCNAKVNAGKIKLSEDIKASNLISSDLFLQNDNESDDDPSFSELRTNNGSKIAATARYITEIINSDENVKLIVFSQLDTSLFKFATILERHDPDTFADKMIMYKGNVHIRKNLLARFNSTEPDAPKILFLSLKNSASGTHLACATHVLLLDSVVGTSGEAQATDAQAIARAHRLGQESVVTAIRFIVVNTVDQQDYENAFGSLLIKPKGLGPKSARK